MHKFYIRTQFTATKSSLHVFQLRGLLQSPQETHARVEQKQQHQRVVLVHEQLAVARLVALATHIVQSLEQRPQPAKIFQALDTRFSQCLALSLQFIRQSISNARLLTKYTWLTFH